MFRVSSGRLPLLLWAALAFAASFGCASTQVTTTEQYGGRLPRPERILVYRFATSPDEVRLDHSPTVVAAWKAQGISATSEQRQVGHAVADALADNLVRKIRELGLPAERADGPLPEDERPTLAIDGQFLAISEGSRAERVVIGLGAGRSDVQTAVQVTEVVRGGRRQVDQFNVDAKSGRKPGVAETMGAGAAAGDLAVSAAVSAAGAVGSEAFGANVEADARRTADKVASVLETFFARQGWIAAASE
jgi:hypothetical protein